MAPGSSKQEGMDEDIVQTFHALAVRSAEQEVYEALRAEIIRGLAPGTALRLKTLADRFRVSTMPVRAAVARLRAEGLVETRPRRGAVVADLSAEDFVDLYAIRMGLEGMAARFGAPQLTADQDEEMRDVIARMKSLGARGGDIIDEYLPLDWKLHDLCYVAAGRPRLLQLIKVYRRQSERYFRIYLGSRLDASADVRGQSAFVRACRRRDGDVAETAIRKLFKGTVDLVLPALPVSVQPPG